MAIRPVYSKFVLPSQKSLEIIINIKIGKKNGGCPLIRACSLIRSNTVYDIIYRIFANSFQILDGADFVSFLIVTD